MHVRGWDAILLALAGLWRQKLRTSLTLLGVVIGTATLALSVSIGLGIPAAVRDQFRKNDRLRQIEVFPDYQAVDLDTEQVPPEVLAIEGNMSPAKRARLRELRIKRWRQRQGLTAPKPLTQEVIASVACLPHVAKVTPDLHEPGRALKNDRWVLLDRVAAVPLDDPRLAERLVRGRTFTSSTAAEALIHEYVLYQWGIRDDAEVAAVLGQTFVLELTNAAKTSPLRLLSLLETEVTDLGVEELQLLQKLNARLPEALTALELSEREREVWAKLRKRRATNKLEAEKLSVRVPLRIVGVLRTVTQAEQQQQRDFWTRFLPEADVLIPLESGARLFQQLPRRQQAGIARVTVIVDEEDQVAMVEEQIRKLGLKTFALVEILRQIRGNVLLVTIALNFIALVALTVAALGITNTLFTSVLERTREIGILKAVGARDGHILRLFLGEGSIIGMFGGGLGLLVARLAAIPGDRVARVIMQRLTEQPVEVTMFRFPLWLMLALPTFATLVTIMAAVYPARRAARVEPVQALRHD